MELPSVSNRRITIRGNHESAVISSRRTSSKWFFNEMRGERVNETEIQLRRQRHYPPVKLTLAILLEREDIITRNLVGSFTVSLIPSLVDPPTQEAPRWGGFPVV